MGMPMIIGAGIGALGSAAMGKSPFTGALLGGTLGGLGGAGGLFGAAEGAGTAGTIGTNGLIGGANLTGAGVAGGTSTGATSGLGSFLSSIKGVETAPVSLGTGGYASGITSGFPAAAGLEGQSLEQALGYTIPKQNLANIVSPENIANSGFPKFGESGFNNLTTGANVGAPYSAEALSNNPLMSQQLANNAGQTTSMMSKVGNYISNMPTNAMNYIENNPLSSAKMALDVATPTPQQQIQAPVPPILKSNYDPSSSLLNVAPRVTPTAGSKTGLIDAMARIPMTDEERIRLQQLVYRG